MAQNTRKSNLIDVITQLHATAVADYRRKMASGTETTCVEATSPCTEELLAGISELEDLQDELREWLREDPDRLSQLFPEIPTAVH